MLDANLQTVQVDRQVLVPRVVLEDRVLPSVLLGRQSQVVHLHPDSKK